MSYESAEGKMKKKKKNEETVRFFILRMPRRRKFTLSPKITNKLVQGGKQKKSIVERKCELTGLVAQ